MALGLLFCSACVGSVGSSQPSIPDASPGPDVLSADTGAGQDDGGTRSDGGSDGGSDVGGAAERDAGLDAGGPVGGATVAMFVASGQGRLATSCDDGRTWFEQTPVPVGGDGFEGPQAAKGLAYGGGVFMHLRGWGGPCTVLVSTNGVDWTRRPVAVGDFEPDTCADVQFADDGFVVIHWTRESYRTTDRGASWSSRGRADFDRFVRMGGAARGSIMAMRPQGEVAHSFDYGDTWQSQGTCSWIDSNGTFSPLGHSGGVATVGDTTVVMGALGQTCRSQDLLGWQEGSVAQTSTELGRLVAVDGAFWALTDQNFAYRSADGAAWERVDFSPASVRIRAMARSSSGTYAAMSSDGRFYRSEDGTTWVQTYTADSSTLNVAMTRLVFGFGEPSARCPRP